MQYRCTAVSIVTLWVFIFNSMRDPKDKIFDLQCWRYIHHIFSDSSRCLGCSASLLNSSFMLSILQLSWLWNWEWKDTENPGSRAEYFCGLYLLEPEACGLFAAQACFTQGFPNLLLTSEKTKQHNLVTRIHLYICASILEMRCLLITQHLCFLPCGLPVMWRYVELSLVMYFCLFMWCLPLPLLLGFSARSNAVGGL